MKKVEIAEATQEDIESFYGTPFDYSSYTFAAKLEGRTIGLAGVYLDGSERIAFSDMKEELRSRKKDIIRLSRANMCAIRQRAKSVIAIANPKEPTSQTLMKHLGFEHIGTTHFGEAYKWHP